MIGCEYASIFRGLNVKVDLINTRDRLLAFLDQEMSDSLSYHFWNSGVVIRHNEEFEKIEGVSDGVIMHLKSGKRSKPIACCTLTAVPVIPIHWRWKTSGWKPMAVDC